MAAYDPEQWHDYFVAAAGAAAALTGLLFVSISINLQRIIENPSLPRRAICTLSLLISIMVVALFCLAPAQARVVLGIELVGVGGAMALLVVVLLRRDAPRPEAPPGARLTQLSLLVTPAAAIAVGGLSLAAEAGGGIYWVMAGFAVGFVGATVNAWVFLVEIQR